MLERERIDDRAVDLWSPLVALAIVADAEGRGRRTPELLAAARQLGALRDADAEGGSTSLLLATLESVRTKLGETPTPGSSWPRPGKGPSPLAKRRPLRTA